MSLYQRPMSPWPELERYARTVRQVKNGLTLHTYDAGAGTATPCCSFTDWEMKRIPGGTSLAAVSGRRVVALDLRLWRSDKPERPYTIPFFQDVAIGLLDTLAIQRAILIGHSLGAVLAHSVALNYPERWSD